MSDDDEEMEAAAGPAQRNMPANRGIITPDQVRKKYFMFSLI